MRASLLFLFIIATAATGQAPIKLADLNAMIGTNPTGPSALVGGILYFTCASGGTYGAGTLVTHVPGVGTFKLLDFHAPTTGSTPRGVVAEGNNLYITLGFGGSFGNGAFGVYSLLTGMYTQIRSIGGQTAYSIGGGFGWFIQSQAPYKIELSTGAVTAVGSSSATWILAGDGYVAYFDFPTVFVGASGGPFTGQFTPSNVSGGSGFGISDGHLRWNYQLSGQNFLTEVNLSTGLQSTTPIGSSVASQSFYVQGQWTVQNQCMLFPAFNGIGLFHVAAKKWFEGVSWGPTSIGDGAASITRTPSGCFIAMTGGGNSNSGSLVWIPAPILATAVPFGLSCNSASLTMQAVAPPRLGEAFSFGVSGAPPFAQGTYYFSAPSAVTTPVSGCNVYLDFATVATLGTMFTTPFGSHSLLIPIPALPAIAGAPARIQAIVLPQGGGFQLTNALDIVLGF